ncbi:hypothetical protein GE061_008478 [Apolygus lucorum]|uniref:Uncharacterized protein n=1 Tax=Apolygus lucorum TaxID=248454 RepID=A0A8S9WMI5_APOLU|nr:hypothetical protein GE061_008478 [Apolygus lucorum]
MVVGFDVCHDKALSQTSVGALVASLDSSYTRYYSSVTFHKDGSELCDCKGVPQVGKDIQDSNHSSQRVIFCIYPKFVTTPLNTNHTVTSTHN